MLRGEKRGATLPCRGGGGNKGRTKRGATQESRDPTEAEDDQATDTHYSLKSTYAITQHAWLLVGGGRPHLSTISST